LKVMRMARSSSLVVATVCAAIGSMAQWRIHWSYEGKEGPARWSALAPEYSACAGKEQSPIDIRRAEKITLPPLRFEYSSEPLKYLINNGYTIRVNYHDAPGAGSFLVVGGQRYQLKQFHFHRPSEEYIEGSPYPMEVHFMLQSRDGHIVGVAVFLKPGKANATIQKIWEHMPASTGSEQDIPGVEIDPAGLLPPDTRYYTYDGSITAPPCTEGVRWFVLKTPVDISAEQIHEFAKLYPHDVRPIQPLNGRVVKETADIDSRAVTGSSIR
jgi:carbonic anhydrase